MGEISMVYRLLAVNIDGTLLQSNGRLNKMTKEAIEYVHQKGVHVALVTNRSFYSAKKVAKSLKINPMIIAHQGAFVAETIEKPLLVKRISEELSLEIVQLLERTSCQIQLLHEKASLANRINTPENLLSRAVMTLNDPHIFSQNYVEVLSEELHERPFAPTKVDVIFSQTHDLNDVYRLLKNLFPEIEVIRQSEDRLTLVPKGISKWSGLLYLANHLRIKRNEIVAIGDGVDDIDMIVGVGLGVAMGNAAPEVKAAAKWVTRSNDENGVGYMLKEFFRKQQPIEFLQKMNVLK
jgi:Cof subfamily protein (haloacid dehalogenase superfamily)